MCCERHSASASVISTQWEKLSCNVAGGLVTPTAPVRCAVADRVVGLHKHRCLLAVLFLIAAIKSCEVGLIQKLTDTYVCQAREIETSPCQAGVFQIDATATAVSQHPGAHAYPQDAPAINTLQWGH
jgi:hypothetical protein